MNISRFTLWWLHRCLGRRRADPLSLSPRWGPTLAQCRREGRHNFDPLLPVTTLGQHVYLTLHGCLQPTHERVSARRFLCGVLSGKHRRYPGQRLPRSSLCGGFQSASSPSTAFNYSPKPSLPAYKLQGQFLYVWDTTMRDYHIPTAADSGVEQVTNTMDDVDALEPAVSMYIPAQFCLLPTAGLGPRRNMMYDVFATYK